MVLPRGSLLTRYSLFSYNKRGLLVVMVVTDHISNSHRAMQEEEWAVAVAILAMMGCILIQANMEVVRKVDMAEEAILISEEQEVLEALAIMLEDL